MHEGGIEMLRSEKFIANGGKGRDVEITTKVNVIEMNDKCRVLSVDSYLNEWIT